MNPNAIYSLKCKGNGYLFKGFHVFLSHYDEGVGLFMPDQSFVDGQEEYILIICNYGSVSVRVHKGMELGVLTYCYENGEDMSDRGLRVATVIDEVHPDFEGII